MVLSAGVLSGWEIGKVFQGGLMCKGSYLLGVLSARFYDNLAKTCRPSHYGTRFEVRYVLGMLHSIR